MAQVKLLDPQDPRNKLDRYELIGEIASGGMAVVYLARIAGVGGFQRFVAIKRLHSHLAGEREFVEMFIDEARLAAGIHNPHVVPILEVGSSDQGYYLVMEYIEGDTLARVAARAAGRATGQQPAATMTGKRKVAPGSMPATGTVIPRPVTVRILLDALAGLHAAHELTDPQDHHPLEIVHRDISPQNILVGVDGSARLTDFGVARAASRLSTTRSDTVKGKLAYLSPEQARGEQIDRRTDIFAMGIVLWELFTGRRLFRGETDHETLARVLSGTIPPPSSLVPGMHPALDAVSLRALARDVAQRYSTCAEMADALERAATEAAPAGADGGVAAPREVAAFMNSVLGQEIAAQRESVRVWLSQRNDPTIASLRGSAPLPAPARQTATLPSGAAPIVAPLPAPPMPPALKSTPPPAPALPAEGYQPVIGSRDPADGDPTVLRLSSSLTNASVSRSGAPSEPPPAKRNTARTAAVIGAVALLAVIAFVLFKTTQGAQTTADSPATSGAVAVSAAATGALPSATATAAASQISSAEPTAEPTASATAGDAPSSTADTPRGGNKKWRPPSTGGGHTTPTATATATKTTKPGDDFSNPYK